MQQEINKQTSIKKRKTLKYVFLDVFFWFAPLLCILARTLFEQTARSIVRGTLVVNRSFRKKNFRFYTKILKKRTECNVHVCSFVLFKVRREFHKACVLCSGTLNTSSTPRVHRDSQLVKLALFGLKKGGNCKTFPSFGGFHTNHKLETFCFSLSFLHSAVL